MLLGRRFSISSNAQCTQSVYVIPSIYKNTRSTRPWRQNPIHTTVGKKSFLPQLVFDVILTFFSFIFQFSRSTLLPGSSDQKESNDTEEPLGTSPPLELRRTMAAQRIAVPHSLQSPQDRATGKSNFIESFTKQKLAQHT